MSATSGINAIHILFLAEKQQALDVADGTYAANIASDPRYYMWQGSQQTIPVGMDDDPAGFVRGLKTALPGVNTLRVTFNAFSFNEDGSLHPQYEAFLAHAAAQGFKLIVAYHDGEMQRLGPNLSTDALYGELAGQVKDRMMQTWDRMLDWLDDHASVRNAVWGYELANEPAAYLNGVAYAARGTKATEEARFVDLYARHMAEAAHVVQSRTDAKILVPGWGYSGRFDALEENQVGSRSALSYLRQKIGDDLVWAAHLYPGWHSGASITDPAALKSILAEVLRPLGSDDILLTETNLSGAWINNFGVAPNLVTAFSRIQEFFADRGIGITWFAGAEAGASSLVTIDPGSKLRYLHQHSLAFAMNAFSLDDNPAAHAAGQRIVATFIPGRLRNEAYEPDANSFDPVTGLGMGFGYGGNDTIVGRNGANNMLYGGKGDDLVTGAGAEDFLFGQYGNDTLIGLVRARPAVRGHGRRSAAWGPWR
jgi:hypothetical protein